MSATEHATPYVDAGDPVRTVLLLGGTGFIGTNLAAALAKLGMRVLVAGRGAQARDGRAAIDLPLGEVDAIVDRAVAERVDTVVHLACGLLPSSAEAEYLLEWERVGAPALRLARRLAAAGIAFTFLSSGGTVYGVTASDRVAEDAPCRPISLYGQAKLELELHLGFLARTAGLRLLVLRPSNPYGAHQPLRGAQGLVSVVLGRIVDGIPLDVWGEGIAVRDYIHVADAAAAMAGLIAARAQGTYNIGSGIGHSLLEVVALAEAATGRTVPLRFHPGRAADVPRLVLDVTRLAARGLGHHARPLALGVRDYAAELGVAHAG